MNSPRMWPTTSRSEATPVPDLPRFALARTHAASIGWGWQRNMSSVSRHELIFCSADPPIVASLSPPTWVYAMPTSSIAPHCIATPTKITQQFQLNFYNNTSPGLTRISANAEGPREHNMLLEILPKTKQLYEKHRLKKLAVSGWPSTSFKVIGVGASR